MLFCAASRYFVDRLFSRRFNDPRNHTNGHEQEVHRVKLSRIEIPKSKFKNDH